MNDTQIKQLAECAESLRQAGEMMRQACIETGKAIARFNTTLHDFGNTAASLHVLRRMGKGEG